VPFLDPNQRDDEDEALPGAPGLHLDLDVKRCPSCHREGLPWQRECPECGTALVSPQGMPPESFPLPGLLLDDEADEADKAGDDRGSG
jgi:hypothetical protein